MEDSTVTTKQSSFVAVSASLSSRYEGLIDIAFTSKIKNAVVSLLSYFDNFGPIMPIIYSIVGVFRLLQLGGPSLMAQISSIWPPESLAGKTISIISILYHFVPVTIRCDVAAAELYIYSGLSLLYIGYLFIAAMYYKKTTKVDKFTTYFLDILIAFFSFFFHPAGVEAWGELFSAMVGGKYAVNALTISSLVVSICFLFLQVYLTVTIYTLSLSFRPCSLQTVEQYPQNCLLIVTCTINLVIAISTDLGKIAHIVCAVISIFLYIYLIYTALTTCSFTRDFDCACVIGTCLGGIINLIIRCVTLAINYVCDEKMLIASIAIFIVTIIASFYYIKRRTVSDLITLDRFADGETEGVLTSVKAFKRLIRTGYCDAHASVLNYQLQNEATKEWPDNIQVSIILAKFTAIYPESAQMLIAISKKLALDKTIGGKTEAIQSDIGSIMKMRETTLTPDLKNRLGKISKLSSKAKNKLRNIWDLVLQGNTNDMEQNIHSTYDAISNLHSELNHLVMNYPNNRFVARQYARFFKEITADHEEYKKWAANVQTLQRGGVVNTDRIHDLGMLAFPLIPSSIETIREAFNFATDTDNEDFLSEEEATLEQSEILLSSIENYKSPGIRCIFVGSILLYLIAFLAPTVVLVVYFNFFAAELKEPLALLYGTAYTRSLVNLGTALTLYTVACDLEDPKNAGHDLMTGEPIKDYLQVDAFGGFKNRYDISKYVVKRIISMAKYMSQINDYRIGNQYVDLARSYLYDATTVFSTFKGQTADTIVEDKVPAADIPSRVASHLITVLGWENIVAANLQTPEFLTAVNNNVHVSDAMNSAMTALNDFIINWNASNQTIFIIVMVVLIVFVVLLYCGVLWFQLKTLKQNKREVFKIFTVLPKSVISTIASSFYSIKNHSTSDASSEASDSNKQEDNIVKIFASLSDGSGNSQLAIVYTFVTIFCAALSAGSIYVCCSTFQSASTQLNNNAPQINYLFGASMTMAESFCSAFRLIFHNYDTAFASVVIDFKEEISVLSDTISDMLDFFHYMRFGGMTTYEIPYSGIDEGLDRSTELLMCEDELKPPEKITDAAACLSAEIQMYLFITMMKSLALPLEAGEAIQPDQWGVPSLFKMGPILLYNSFFYPTAMEIVTTISSSIQSFSGPLIGKAVGFLLAGLVLTIIMIVIGFVESHYMLFTLRLLKHCPASVVTQSNAIMNLLSGHKSSKNEETAARNDVFFTAVMNRITDIVIVVNSADDTITTVNDTFCKFFDMEREEILNTRFDDFFTESRFRGDLNPNFQHCEVVFKKGKDDNHLSMNSIVVGTNRIINCRDETQRYLHQQLIADERKKSDTLLSSILPASLVPRVQNGERNISFSVQSVSVLFLDIVSFTPWCGSHEAAYIMKMLNLLFKELDALVATHKTLTKIKCIGDCYMAAGGIFDEINQPAVHSKEMVEFGCQAIKKIEEIDESYNEKLQIRVGINTGGPIVAGVLGTEKPTFEILGPAINIAQQMEHNGVPMMVHCSRPVYELIYGSSFQIKERGEIAIKNGKMLTYLVDPKSIDN